MEEEKTNEKKKKKKGTSLNRVLGGDAAADFFRRQIGLFVMLTLMAVYYIHNRYDMQQKLIEIDQLKTELKEAKYDALTQNSELVEKIRQSRIEDYISKSGSDLKAPVNPPYLVK